MNYANKMGFFNKKIGTVFLKEESHVSAYIEKLRLIIKVISFVAIRLMENG